MKNKSLFNLTQINCFYNLWPSLNINSGWSIWPCRGSAVSELQGYSSVCALRQTRVHLACSVCGQHILDTDALKYQQDSLSWYNHSLYTYVNLCNHAFSETSVYKLKLQAVMKGPSHPGALSPAEHIIWPLGGDGEYHLAKCHISIEL